MTDRVQADAGSPQLMVSRVCRALYQYAPIVADHYIAGFLDQGPNSEVERENAASENTSNSARSKVSDYTQTQERLDRAFNLCIHSDPQYETCGGSRSKSTAPPWPSNTAYILLSSLFMETFVLHTQVYRLYSSRIIRYGDPF